jgi:radical SAM protein with 4Fe4S-binding SPASM domain
MPGPVYVDWAITNICNLKCRHCVGMEKEEISHVVAVRITNEVIGLKPRWVILEGGEPLLRQDLEDIGGRLRQAGIDIYVISNGNAFTETRFNKLITFSPKVLFSIDGSTADTYEYTKTGASFITVQKWAKRLAEAGLFYGITSVLSKINLSQIKDLIKLTKDLGGSSIIFLPLKPFGENCNPYYLQNALSPDEQERAIVEIYRNQGNLEVFYDEPFLWNVAQKHGITVSNASSGITIPEVQGCAACHSLYIQTSGSVRPCMFAPEKLTFGNVTEEPLNGIWEKMQKSSILNNWKDQRQRKGTCSRCQLFQSCRGCLARTYSLYGSVLEADLCCPLGN